MRHAARLPPPPIFDDRRLVQLIAFRKLVSSWRLLAFSQNFAFESKARQKYCEKGAPSGVVGSCPRIVWPISSGHAALVVQNGRQKFQNDSKFD